MAKMKKKFRVQTLKQNCRFLVVSLIILLFSVGKAVCQEPESMLSACPEPQPLPPGWQRNTASLVEKYPDVKGDTLIARACGASLSVACVRDKGNNGLYYTFVVRNYEDGTHYRSFQSLRDEVDTMVNFEGRYIETRKRYYVRDMRLADSVCFFCGMIVTSQTQISMHGSSTTEVPNQQILLSVDSVGFMGRFWLADVIVPTLTPIWPGGGLSPMAVADVPIYNYALPTSLYVQLGKVPYTSVLDKMWIDEGLHMDMGTGNNCIDCPPFYKDSVYYDADFNIDSVQAFVIGRLKNDAHRSCLVNMTDMFNTDSPYSLKVSPMENEIFYDVMGIDARVFLSSCFGGVDENEFSIGYRYDFQSGYSSKKTIGIRYRDLHRNQIKSRESHGQPGEDYYIPWDESDYSYFNNLHLYQSTNNLNTYPDDDHARNYGHLCRMKSRHLPLMSNGVYYREFYSHQDICVVARFGEEIGLIHIDKDMEPVYSFSINTNRFSIIEDVVCVGNTLANSLAIAYRGTFEHIDLVDWNTEMNQGQSPSDGVFTNVKLSSSSYMSINSLDMFFNGTTLLVGGLTSNNMMMQAAQRKNAWAGNWGNNHSQPDYLSCFGKEPIRLDHSFPVTHASYNLGLVDYGGYSYRVSWSIRKQETIADHEVNVVCTK